MSAVRRILQVGVDHRAVSLDTIAACHGLRQKKGEPPVLSPGQGLVPLATCHRLELFLENVPSCHAEALFWTWLHGDPEPPAGLQIPVKIRRGEQAAHHLLTVTAGLESAVLGEDQILMQVRKAYRTACDENTATVLLHRLFHTAFRAGKRVRSRTEVGSGGRSLSGAAVAVMQDLLGGLADKRVLVIGLGEMGDLAACRLRKRGVGELVLCNRTRARADKLADHLGAQVLPWEWRASGLDKFDAIVCATGALEPVITAEELTAAAAGRSGDPLVGIDLSVPRNLGRVEVPTAGLYLLDVQALTHRLESEEEQRHDALAAARVLVGEQLREWVGWVAARENHAYERPGDCRRLRAL